jgi:hypothetical protein
VSNRGEKPISAVSWDYAVVDVENNVEVGRRSFKNVVNIKPGKSASLVRRSRNPPSSVVRVSKSGEARSQYVERVIIDRVEYVDGTFWQRPAN